jgi:hypothetical protein
LRIRTRELDVETERDLMIAFLGENLPGHGGAAHFDWLYRDNPDGVARAWLAVDDETEEPVGAAAAFPRRVWVHGTEMVCWNLGDFAIRKEYRSLGPAMILQRACLQPVIEGRIPFAYDHPSCVMLAIYKRMGIPETGRITRFAKLLRVDEQVARLLKFPAVAGGISGIANVVLSIADRGLLVKRRCGVGSRVERFDERATALERDLAREHPVVGSRRAAYLNWRYVDNPLQEHEILTLEADSRLVGYAVIRHEGQNARLMDLYTEKNSEFIDGLVAGVIEALRAGRTRTLNAPLLEASPLVPVLKRWGFRARESHPFVVSAPPRSESAGTVQHAGNWYLTAGDRDV